MKKTLMLTVTMLMGALGARGVVYNPRLGAYYATITQAVAAAAMGDRLHVSTGIYVETVWLTNELTGLVLSGGYATNGVTRLHGAYSVITRGGIVAGSKQTVTIEYFALTGILNRTALRVQDGVCVTCATCRITGNRGSVFIDVAGVVDVRDGGRLVLTNTVVQGNSHPTRGGGAIVTGGKSMLIVESDSTIEENAAPLGGGVTVESGGALVVRGVVRGNTATSGGGVYVNRGSVFAHGATAAIGNMHGGNMATNVGGGIYSVRATVMVSNGAVIAANQVWNDGGGVYAEDSMLWFHDATLGNVNTNYGNYAVGSGGGLYLQRSTATFEHALVGGNMAGEVLNRYGGGGIMLADGSHVSLVQSVMQGNRAQASGGGGLAVNGNTITEKESSWVMEETQVVSNYAAWDGGAVACLSEALWPSRMTGTVVQENEAGAGGGMCLDGASMRGEVVIEGCTWANNRAVASGGAVAAKSGTITIRGTRMSGNTAHSGGALYAWGSKAKVVLNSSSGLTNEFDHNTATNGGAWYLADATRMEVEDACVVRENRALRDGGGVLVSNATLVVMCTNGPVCSWVGNYAARNGGGVAVIGADGLLEAQGLACLVNRAGEAGGALHAEHARVMMYYASSTVEGTMPVNRLEGNYSGSGFTGAISLKHGAHGFFSDISVVTNRGASYDAGFSVRYASSCCFVNAVLISNTAAFGQSVGSVLDTSMVTLVHVTVAGHDSGCAVDSLSRLTGTNTILWSTYYQVRTGVTGFVELRYCDVRGGWPGEGNIAADPRFVDPVHLNYQLAVDSPCINTGINAGVSYDCVGTPRPYGGGYDMGAYEFVPEPGGLGLAGLLGFTIWRRRRGK